MTTTTKKITRATFKSFVTKYAECLLIKNVSNFDGMVDCVMPVQRDFRFATKSTRHQNADKYTLGINGVWLVGSSRDYFTAYEDDNFKGIEVSNCCGDFIVAICKNCEREKYEYNVRFCTECYANGGEELDKILSESDMNLLKQCDGVHDSVQDIINCKSCEVLLK